MIFWFCVCVFEFSFLFLYELESQSGLTRIGKSEGSIGFRDRRHGRPKKRNVDLSGVTPAQKTLPVIPFRRSRCSSAFSRSFPFLLSSFRFRFRFPLFVCVFLYIFASFFHLPPSLLLLVIVFQRLLAALIVQSVRFVCVWRWRACMPVLRRGCAGGLPDIYGRV